MLLTLRETGLRYVLCSDPLELLPDPDLPEVDDCPEAGLCGEIWPLPVPVLPAFVCCVLPVPGPPCSFHFLSSVRPVFDPGIDPLWWVEVWLPPVFEPLPDWVPRSICCCEPCCCEPLLDWLSRFPDILPRDSLLLAIRLLLEMPPLHFVRTRSGGSALRCPEACAALSWVQCATVRSGCPRSRYLGPGINDFNVIHPSKSRRTPSAAAVPPEILPARAYSRHLPR